MDAKARIRQRLQEQGKAPKPKIAIALPTPPASPPAPAKPKPKPKIPDTRDILLAELDKDVERAKYLTIGTALIMIGVFLGILIAD